MNEAAKARLQARCAKAWSAARRGCQVTKRDKDDMRRAFSQGLLPADAAAWVSSGLMDAY